MKERLTKRIDNKTYFIIKTEGNDFYSDGEDLTFNYYDKEVQKTLDRLADYEDLEEQGLLVRLPCKVGDKVWYLKDYGFKRYRVEDMEVVGFNFSRYDNTITVIGRYNEHADVIYKIKSEAEKKLKGLKFKERVELGQCTIIDEE